MRKIAIRLSLVGLMTCATIADATHPPEAVKTCTGIVESKRDPQPWNELGPVVTVDLDFDAAGKVVSNLAIWRPAQTAITYHSGTVMFLTSIGMWYSGGTADRIGMAQEFLAEVRVISRSPREPLSHDELLHRIEDYTLEASYDSEPWQRLNLIEIPANPGAEAVPYLIAKIPMPRDGSRRISLRTLNGDQKVLLEYAYDLTATETRDSLYGTAYNSAVGSQPSGCYALERP